MKIREFIEKMKENGADISRTISAKMYIPVSDKMLMTKGILDECIDYERGFIKFDSIKKHLMFTFSVIEAHTELRFSNNFDEKVNEYDLLCENDLLDMIINTFKRDYDESRCILDMMCLDMLSESSIEASVAKVAQSVVENLDVFIGTLADKIEDLDVEKIIPKDLDLDKLQELLNRFK